MPRRLLLIGSLLLVAFSGGQPAKPKLLDELLNSRSKIRPFLGRYLEQLRVPDSGPPRAGSWGSADSDRYVVSGVSADSSYYSVEPYGTSSAPMGGTEVLSKDGKYYEKVSKGSQGGFGSKSPGDIPPASSMYEVIGMTLSHMKSTGKVAEAPESGTITFTKGERTYLVQTELRGKQRVINRVEKRSSSNGKSILLSVDSWIEDDGNSYPKVMSLRFTDSGAVYQTRVYSLDKRITDLSAMKWSWQEGSIIKDRDANKVYRVRNGQLVLDPVFSKEAASSVTWRHGVVILCACGIVAWALYRRTARGPRQAKVGGT